MTKEIAKEMPKETAKAALKEILNTPASKLTAEQKEVVKEYAKEYGVPFTPKSRCKDCYHDAAMQIYNKLTQEDAELEAEAEAEAQEETRRYILRPGVDVWFGNIRVNPATLTDELAEYIISRGFKTKYFIKCA